MVKQNCELTPDDVKKMSLDEFENRFKWRPVEALEKWGWAMQGKRMREDQLKMFKLGILDMPDLTDVCME